MTTYRVCCCFRRKFRPASDEPPEGIRDLFRRYSGESGLMGVEQMERFLTEVQREKGDVRAMAQGIVEGSWEFKHLNLFKKGALTLDAFFRYLSGDGNPPLLPRVHHDMTAPLSHYFIYTGHNSYLTGNQLSSDCSDVPIIKALRNGVRVIELDMWPNSTNDDVNIYHGRTATTPVGLLKCLISIRENAFFVSPYPVIITLEDHLTAHLQTKVAEMIRQTFGDMLFVPDSEFLEEFPSPEGLKMKIVISTKPPKEYLEAKVTSRKDDQDLQQVKDEEGAWGNELREFEGGLNVDIEDGDDKEEHLEDEEDMDDGDHKSHQNIATQYKRLIGIPARKAKGAFTESFKVDPKKVGRLSLSEQVLEKAIISHGSEIVRFAQRNLLRIYPKGTRITSSNYNPMIGWMHGAQMVAFNMQGHGRPLWLMHGMFRANGGCGYVKKPDILVKPNGIFNPRANLQIKTIFKVRVYMGDGWRYDFSHRHFDTYSPPDFYTKVGIAGVPADTIMMKTRVIEDNWVPVWDEEFVFSLRVPELALLRIEVHEYDMNERDDFAGQTCLPLSELRVGIRAVPLFTRKGEKLPSVKLLMHFDFF